MKCSSCRFDNQDGVKSCAKCGADLFLTCPHCNKELRPSAKFCDECGRKLEDSSKLQQDSSLPESERKFVTVLFSDLSGYTSMCENLDPEDVKEIMSRIFGDITKVVTKYGGTIDKFIGDAVMALFGLPQAHEDDPVRAIKAALEIHELVSVLGTELENRIGRTLSMHSGINTGLAMTSVSKSEDERIFGDTINLASRLADLAKGGEIFVGPVTYNQSDSHYVFEAKEPTMVKGKAAPVPVYKVLSLKTQLRKVRRLHGRRSELVGRAKELDQLKETIGKLRRGEGGIISICGEAGTGKSRLVEELKASLDLEKIQWREGYAYSFAQGMPYFPIINFLNRSFDIDEGDTPGRAQEKFERGIEQLRIDKEEVIPSIGSLLSLRYPEMDSMSPDTWKSRIQEAVQAVFSAMAARGPTVVFFEDLHWADSSSLELIRFILGSVLDKAAFISTCRPPFTLLPDLVTDREGELFQEIGLGELSSSETQHMLESLLDTRKVPSDLSQFIQLKTEGNPFYLEEAINSLIDSESLLPIEGEWHLAKDLEESDIPPTVQGVISARIDLLEKKKKRVLQEAAVIGRVFPHAVLSKASDCAGHIDESLETLQQVDLIRTKSLEPDLEFIFKHALTQDVVYNSLPMKERKQIHERIGLATEEIFKERLPEFHETLAYHFKNGQSAHKAVEYLMKSGEKSLRRYSLDEAHKDFCEALDILKTRPGIMEGATETLPNLMYSFLNVFNYRGDYNGAFAFLTAHEAFFTSFRDPKVSGIFYGWRGFMHWHQGKLSQSYDLVRKAQHFADQSGDRKVTAYVMMWMSWVAADLGYMDDSIRFGKQSYELASSLEYDVELMGFALFGLATAYWFSGRAEKVLEVGDIFFELGRVRSEIRHTVLGHLTKGIGFIVQGDFPSSIDHLQQSYKKAIDPIFSLAAQTVLARAYLLNGQMREAKDVLDNAMTFIKEQGLVRFDMFSRAGNAILLLSSGSWKEGLKILRSLSTEYAAVGGKYGLSVIELVLGNFYLQLVLRNEKPKMAVVVRNFFFLLKNIPFTEKKALHHLGKASSLAEEIGAKGILGNAAMNLCLLHRAKGRREEAQKYIDQAIDLFTEFKMDGFLEQAKTIQASL